MASRGQALTITYVAWDTSANAGKTGDGGNHTLRWVKDGTAAAPEGGPSEVDASNAPGLYKLTLTAAECTCHLGVLAGKSSTSGVVVIPVTITFEQLPTASPGTSGGLPTADANNRAKADLEAIDGEATDGNHATLYLKQLSVVNDAGPAIVAQSTGNQGAGIEAAGHGSGPGVLAGGGATAPGVEAKGGATYGPGLYAHAYLTGNGIEAAAAGVGSGLNLQGSGSGFGLNARGGIAGHGICGKGGLEGGDGIHAEAQGDGDGIEALGSGSGYDLNADVHGGLSGAVGSLSAEERNQVADAVLARNVSHVEAAAAEHSLCTVVLAALESSTSGTTWTIKRTDGNTTHATKTVTKDATAQPITGVS